MERKKREQLRKEILYYCQEDKRTCEDIMNKFDLSQRQVRFILLGFVQHEKIKRIPNLFDLRSYFYYTLTQKTEVSN